MPKDTLTNTLHTADLLMTWARNAANAFTQALAQRAGVSLPKWDNLALRGDVKLEHWLAEQGITTRKTAEEAGATTAANLICWWVECEAGTAAANQVAAYRQLKAEDFAADMLEEHLLIDEFPQELEDGRYMVQLNDERGRDFGIVEFQTEEEAQAFIDKTLTILVALKADQAGGRGSKP